MEAQLKGAVLIALVVVPQWRCPILKPLSAKLPPIQDGRMVQFYNRGIMVEMVIMIGKIIMAEDRRDRQDRKDKQERQHRQTDIKT